MTTQRKHAAILGASGYTGGELFRLLQSHPEISISTVVASEKSAGQRLSAIFPHLHSVTSLSLDQLDVKTIAEQADVIFIALPHTQALTPVSELFKLNKLVIDLSADYRLDNPELYTQWYQVTHPYPSLLQHAVYGLPELHRRSIQRARLIAVPGCYPTAAILQLAPLLSHGLIDPSSIIVDAKSGISGAGRGASLPYHFPEAHESIHAYKIGTHRHTVEIEQELAKISRNVAASIDSETMTTHSISFTPHLVPINRGILSTAYATINHADLSQTEWTSVYEDYYKHESFIRIFKNSQDVTPSHVRGSNFCDLNVTYDSRTHRVISVAALDNLVKGAAGQAIQAMNIALGFPEHFGLSHCGLFP